MYSLLIDYSSEHKKVKGVNKNVVATISHNEYKDVSLNKNCLRHSMSRIQSKAQSIKTYEINKVSLSWVDDEIYIQNNEYDELGLCYQRWLYKKTIILITIQKSFFVKP